MSFKVLLEVTVMSAQTGSVSVQLKEVEFPNKIYADTFVEGVDTYEETPDLKVWRLATKLYY